MKYLFLAICFFSTTTLAANDSFTLTEKLRSHKHQISASAASHAINEMHYDAIKKCEKGFETIRQYAKPDNNEDWYLYLDVKCLN